MRSRLITFVFLQSCFAYPRFHPWADFFVLLTEIFPCWTRGIFPVCQLKQTKEKKNEIKAGDNTLFHATEEKGNYPRTAVKCNTIRVSSLPSRMSLNRMKGKCKRWRKVVKGVSWWKGEKLKTPRVAVMFSFPCSPILLPLTKSSLIRTHITTRAGSVSVNRGKSPIQQRYGYGLTVTSCPFVVISWLLRKKTRLMYLYLLYLHYQL